MNALKIFPDPRLIRCINLLSRPDQYVLAVGVLIQFILSLFDLLGVVLLGIIGTLSVRGIQNAQSGTRLISVLKFLHLENEDFRTQVAILSALAVCLFVLKTSLSAIVGKRLMYFLSRRGASLSIKLFKDMLQVLGPQSADQSRQNRIYAVGVGISAISGGVLVQFISIVTDFILLIVILIGVAFISPIMAIAVLLVFSVAASILNYQMNQRAFQIGRQASNLSRINNDHIDETISMFREHFVRGSVEKSISEFANRRMKLADLEAEQRFMPFISKYVIESVMILSIFLVSALQFLLYNAASAVGQMSIFLAATTRLAPAILRIQQSSVSLKGNLGTALPTLEMIDEVNNYLLNKKATFYSAAGQIGASTKSGVLLEAKNVSFKYSLQGKLIVKDFSLEIEQGDHVAITGDSGVGKSTIVDLLIGVREPISGFIRISGLEPKTFIAINPGAIAYIPQRIVLKEGTIFENVVLGMPSRESIDETVVTDALIRAGLGPFIESSPLGLQAQIGPLGVNLSGGQIQRIGIARALISNPKILVLDEATNALDRRTETEVVKNIYSRDSNTTIITIAHRETSLESANVFVRLGKSGNITVKRLGDRR